MAAGDTLVTGALTIAAAILGLPVVFAVLTFVVVGLVQMASCRWIDGHWDAWESKIGAKLRARVDGWRHGRIKGKLVRWGVSGGSPVWYSLAAVLSSPIVVTTAARLITGQPVGRRRVIWSCVVFALFLAVFVGLLGYGMAKAIGSL